MKNIFKNKKYTLIISIISIVLVLGVAGTYAWYVWSTNDEQRNRIVTSVGAATVVYEDGASIIGHSLKPVEDKEQGIVKEINVRTNNNTIFNVTFNLYLDINELGDGLKDQSFRFELWKDEEKIKEGSFAEDYLTQNLVTCNTYGTNHIVLLKDATIDKTFSTYKLYIWIDGVNYTNPDTMMDQKFSFRLHADGQNAVMSETVYPSGTFMHAIASKYNNSSNKDTVTNGGVTYSYDKDNNLLLDNDGNIRYFGASPNNYVYFNCQDYKNPTSDTCEKWRVIGIVDGKVKIVREETLGDFSWNYDSEGNTSNNWKTSTLNQMLNNGYYNNLDNVTYYKYNATGPVKSAINFATSGMGLTEATRNNKLISETNWYVNGMDSGSYAHELYTNERTELHQWVGNRKWTGNIALMYPSDYAYAADFRVCDKDVYKYNDTNCYNNNWINIMNHALGNNSALLLTHFSTSSVRIWRIAYGGEIKTDGGSNTGWRAYPTLYLDEEVVTFGGDGSSDSPYKIYPGDKKNELPRANLKEYIIELYSSSNPALITHKDENNNKIADYYYSTSVNLMNDGLDSSGDFITDATALTNGTRGNIRYYGATPNNYIYFNCDDYNNQSDSTCEKWRIIGIVDGKVKIIRDEPIGNYAWDYTSTGEYDNNWHDSTLQILLNNGYYNNGDGITYYIRIYNSETSKFEPNKVIINFKIDNKGIKNDKTRNMISESTWYLGGNHSISAYSNNIYDNERGAAKCSSCTYDTTWIGKIGLMYPSDYMYAADLSVCNQILYYYDNTNCKGTDWLFNSRSDLLITPDSSSSTHAFYVLGYGRVDSYGGVHSAYGVRAVLYLDSELSIGSEGDGSTEAPYQLVVS